MYYNKRTELLERIKTKLNDKGKYEKIYDEISETMNPIRELIYVAYDYDKDKDKDKENKYQKEFENARTAMQKINEICKEYNQEVIFPQTQMSDEIIYSICKKYESEIPKDTFKVNEMIAKLKKE